MDKTRIRSIIESLLFVSGEPMSLERISQILEGVEKKELRQIISELAQEYLEQGRGIRIVEVAGGYQFETARENAEYLLKLIKTRPARLTRPALETLAIIAYRQPITRLEIDEIRGVDSSGVIRTLLEYGLIQVMGRKDVPGRPLVYGTTQKFLEFFRLKSLADLPSPEEFAEEMEEKAEQSELFKAETESSGKENEAE